VAGMQWNCLVATVSEQGKPENVYDTTGSIPLKGLPGLSLKVRGPKQFKRNRSQILRFKLVNPGDGSAKRGTIRAGKQKKFRIRVRFNDRARKLTRVVLKGSSGKLRLKGKMKLRVKTPKPPRHHKNGGGGGGGSSQTPGVCVQYAPDLSGETGGSLILVPCLR